MSQRPRLNGTTNSHCSPTVEGLEARTFLSVSHPAAAPSGTGDVTVAITVAVKFDQPDLHRSSWDHQFEFPVGR